LLSLDEAIDLLDAEIHVQSTAERKALSVLIAAARAYAPMKEALEWYADESNYHETAPIPGMIDGVFPIENDEGEKAREVLGRLEGEG
jgi:hypothetical protein